MPKISLVHAATEAALVVRGEPLHYIRLENLGSTQIRFGFTPSTTAAMRTDGHLLTVTATPGSVAEFVATDPHGRNMPREIWASTMTANVDLAVSAW